MRCALATYSSAGVINTSPLRVLSARKFYRAASMQGALSIMEMSVRLSVCPSVKRVNCEMSVGLLRENLAEIRPTPSKTSISDHYLLV